MGLEEILVRDVVDLGWEVFRLRRLEAAFLAAQSLAVVLELFPIRERRGLAHGWAARKPSVTKRVERKLASAGLTMDTIMSNIFIENLNQIECIERMTAMAEARRSAALREIELHRATFAHALGRRPVRHVEDAEYQAIGTESSEGKSTT